MADMACSFSSDWSNTPSDGSSRSNRNSSSSGSSFPSPDGVQTVANGQVQVTNPARTNFLKYFETAPPNFVGNAAVDLDKLGIVFQYANLFYVVYEKTPDPEAGTTSPTLERGWLHSPTIGTYLRQEWNSLPKEQVGKCGHGYCPTDNNRNGWWRVHSKMMQQVRTGCFIRAVQLDDEAMGRQRHGIEYARYLGSELARVVDALYGVKAVQQAALNREADALMSQFIVPEML
ncbi:hypothetical protein P153DRAFT_430935 [Dothidotthia symphoricarpi CBS 119687]|uniref:Uncharacterized protein n=1 Tax=Dothidotthia symphoricarpi CBS 119687 TaxID=1392245 RepID=A0A6A6AFX1_9PLEO|nr:uncharacterized protein P153DRAFT_430935 [Dothidotthia symphoricarpi CBS 119687]KAF2129834.1 hypothetical protein P153DRAFT_430935 [Dothidotthia symphoricarpi CBS 119687]